MMNEFFCSEFKSAFIYFQDKKIYLIKILIFIKILNQINFRKFQLLKQIQMLFV